MRPGIEAIEKQIAQAPEGPWQWEEQDLSNQPRWKLGFCGPPSLLDGNDKVVVNRGCEDCQEEKGNSEEALQLIVDYHNGIVPALLAYVKELEEEVSNRRNSFYQYWAVFVVGQKSFNPVAVFLYYDQAEQWAKHNYRVECKIELFGRDSMVFSLDGVWALMQTTPRLRVIAALKACGVEQHQPAPDGEG